MASAFQSGAFQSDGFQIDAAGVNYSLTLSVGTYAYSGKSAEVPVARNLAAAAGPYTYTGIAATLTYVPGSATINYVLTCSSGTYGYAGGTAAIGIARMLAGTNGSYGYSGQATSVPIDRNLAPVVGAYAFAGISATLTYTPGSGTYILICNSGVYGYSGKAAVLTYYSPPVAGYPDPSVVKWGVMYGPTGTEYTGTFIGNLTVEVTTGMLVKPLTSKLSILL